MTQFSNSARAKLFCLLSPSTIAERSLSWLNRLIIGMILGAVLVAILESEPAILSGRREIFKWLEIVFLCFFAVEYIIRVWVSAEDPAYADDLKGRIRYMLSATALLDLLAIAPLLFLMAGTESYMLRLFRLLRVLRLAKLGRFSKAITAISEAVHSRRFELLASVGFALTLLFIVNYIYLNVFTGGGSAARNFREHSARDVVVCCDLDYSGLWR